MPFELGLVAPQNETVTKTLTILGNQTEVTYYRNKLTMEDTRREGDEADADDEGDTADSVAARLVGLIKAWDWTGPLNRLDGTQVVAAGEAIPLDVDTIRLIPLRVTKALNEAIVESELGGKGNKRSKH